MSIRQNIGGASFEVPEGGGQGDFDKSFNVKVYPTNFMKFSFDNLCRIL